MMIYNLSKNYLKKIYHIFAFLLLHTSLHAQTPRNVPQTHDSYSFNLDTIPGLILYIGLPVIIIILYILYRRREKKRRQNK
jgi:heme/copper-type cytochrome/quinol oxidase subunit 2